MKLGRADRVIAESIIARLMDNEDALREFVYRVVAAQVAANEDSPVCEFVSGRNAQE